MAPTYLSLKATKDLEDKFITYLKEIYLDTTSPVAFSSPRTVLAYIKQQNKFTNVGLGHLTAYMSIFDSYSLNRHRPPKSMPTCRYALTRPNAQLEVDLMSIVRFAKENDDYKYI